MVDTVVRLTNDENSIDIGFPDKMLFVKRDLDDCNGTIEQKHYDFNKPDMVLKSQSLSEFFVASAKNWILVVANSDQK